MAYGACSHACRCGSNLTNLSVRESGRTPPMGLATIAQHASAFTGMKCASQDDFTMLVFTVLVSRHTRGPFGHTFLCVAFTTDRVLGVGRRDPLRSN